MTLPDSTHLASLVQFNCSVMSNALQPQGLQHTYFPVLHYLPESAQTHVHLINNAIQPSHPLSPPSLALILSQHQDLFQWIGFSHQMVKYWSFSFAISPPHEYSGLISFKVDLGCIRSLYFYFPFPMIHTLFVRNGVWTYRYEGISWMEFYPPQQGWREGSRKGTG